MNRAIEVLEIEHAQLVREIALERLSAANQSTTSARGRKARERYTAEAERLDALRVDVERALAVLRTTETEAAERRRLRSEHQQVVALEALVAAALDLGATNQFEPTDANIREVIDHVFNRAPDPTCGCVGCVRRRT